MTPLQAWRRLAGTFHAIELMVRAEKLPQDYKPDDAIFLYREVPVSTHEGAALKFLLHVWNHYDFPFELSEVAGWDPRHEQAFINWVNGQTLGRPCRYF